MHKFICPNCGSDRCKSFEVLLDERIAKRADITASKFPHLISRNEFLPIGHPLKTLPKLESDPYFFRFYLILFIIFMISFFLGTFIIIQLGFRAEFAFTFVVLLIISMLVFRNHPIGKLKEMKAMSEKIEARNKKIKAEYEEKLSKLWKCSSCGNIYDPN